MYNDLRKTTITLLVVVLALTVIIACIGEPKQGEGIAKVLLHSHVRRSCRAVLKLG